MKSWLKEKFSPSLATGMLLAAGLYAISLSNYLLFHSLIELFSVVTAFVIFALAWHTRATHDNDFLLFIGIALLFSGALDLLHLITYKGIGIFPADDGNMPTQFWIAFRAVFSVSFLAGGLFIHSKLNIGRTVALYFIVVSAFIVSILYGWFPDCYVAGSGLTRFKIRAEYAIILVFLAALASLLRRRSAFDPVVLRFTALSLVFSIASEISFTEYASVYGFSNMLGHQFLFASVAFMYRAIVITAVVEPSRLLYRDLKQREEAVSASERRYRMLFGNMINGLAYHRIVCDEQGRPVDYVFLEVNSAFEALTGLKAADLIGKGVREVLPGIEKDPADWIGTYGRVALTGESARFEQPAKGLGKWFSVSAYSPAPQHFVTVFEDITERKKAEAELRASEERFRSVLDNSRDVIYRVNVQTGRLEYISPSAEKVIGFSGDELMARDLSSIHAIIHPDDLPAVRAANALLEETGEGDVEYRQRTKNGGYRWLSNHMSLSRDGAGLPLYRSGNISDVTERKKAEEAVRENEERLRIFIEHAPAAIAMFDRDMRYLVASRRWLSDYGLGKRDLRGLSHYDVFPKIPEDWKESHRRGLAGNVVRNDNDRFDRADGVTQWLRWEVRPWYNAVGEVGGIVILTEDITERKRAEDALRESEEQFRALADSIPNLAWWANSDGYITWYNRRWYEYTGTTAKQMEGWGWQTVHDPALLPKVMERWRMSLATGQPFDMEFPLRGADGVFKPFLTRVMPMKDSAGKVVRWFGTNTDVSERKRAEDALRESEARFRTLTEDSPDCIALHDRELRHIYVNPAIVQLTGLPADSFIGKTVQEAGLPLEVALQIEGMLCSAIDTGTEQDSELIFPMKQGPRYFSWRSVPIKDAECVVQAVMAVATDITQRKIAAEAIRHSEEKFSLAFANNPAAIALTRLDDGTFLNVNDTWVALSGYARDETLGNSARKMGIWPTAEAAARFVRELREKGSLRGWEQEFRKKSGERYTTQLAAQVLTVRDEKLILSTFVDITERKRTEQALQHSMRRFEVLAATAGQLLQTSEPQRVVEALCRKVMEHLDCQAFFNYLVDEQGGKLHLNAYSGISGEQAARIEWLDIGSAVCGCAARDGCRIVAERIPATPDERTELVRSYGIKAYACHPILGPGGKVMGTLSFGTCSRETFSEDDLSLMKAVTDQVAVAMIRMRDEQELRAAHDELELRVQERTAALESANEALEKEIGERLEIERRTGLVNELLKLFTQKFSRKEYLDAAVVLIRDWSGCNHAGIRMLQADGSIPYIACVDFSASFLESENMLSVATDQCACIRVISGKPEKQDLPAMTPLGSFYTNDSVSFVSGLDSSGQARFRGVCVRSGFQSIAIVPIRYREQVYGALHITDERKGMLPLGNIELFEQIALILGEAIFRFGVEEDLRRQRGELARMNEQLRNLSAHVDAVREAERTNIAREIHDELGQVLTAIKMDMAWVNRRLPAGQKVLRDRTEESLQLIDSAIHTVKRISAELRPGILDDIGLSATVEWACKQFAERTGIKCSVTISPENLGVDRMRSTALFRVLQESLTNIMRHAKASRVAVSLQQRDRSIMLTVGDNGKGITADQISSPHAFGLIGMRERVQFLHGDIAFESAPRRGTTVTVTLPIDPVKDQAEDPVPSAGLIRNESADDNQGVTEQ